MVERIKLVMDYYHLRPAQFADAIGMQRSAVSHVLSGRNKPSLDFVLRIKKRYPEINLDWLLLEKGLMLEGQKTEQNFSVPDDLFTEKVIKEKPDGTGEPLPQDDQPARASSTSAGQVDDHEPVFHDVKSGEIPVSRLVLLFEDGTFRVFDPRS